VVDLLKSTVSTVVYLAVFMPIAAGMGGNAGTQALAVTIRSIALGEVMLSDVKKLLFKEIMVGVISGAVVGFVTGLMAFFTLLLSTTPT
jgi:magnesium transporter